MSPPGPFARAAPAGMTPDNWRSHPFSPWAFGNVAQFLPTARVRKGRERRMLATAGSIGPLRFDDGTGRASTLPDFLRNTHADGFLVLHRGGIVCEHYAAATFATTLLLYFSITKSITGLLAEQLIGEGAIDARARAGLLVPELAGSAFGDAVLRDLLDMRDGVAFDEDYADPGAQIHRYSRHFWGMGEGGVLNALTALPAAALRGSPFRYRTPVTDVIGLMIERATGSSLPQLAEARLWRATGAANDARWVLDTGGRAIASAGFACTLRDLARLGLLLVDALKGRSTPDLSRVARTLWAGGDRAAFAAADQPSRPGFSYRSGWWVDHMTGALNALGVFGQRLHIAPDDEVVIARFGSHPVASNQATDVAHAGAFAAIRAALRDA